jgi:hypothetical protein
MRCPVAVFPEYVAWDNKLGVLTGFGSFFQAGRSYFNLTTQLFDNASLT